MSTFQQLNPGSKQTLSLTGTGGVVDLTLQPLDVLHFGVVPCLMPREKTIQIINTGTASINLAVFDLNGTIFSNAGKSYKGTGMLSVRPVSIFLAPGDSQILNVSCSVRESGVVCFPFCLRLLGAKTSSTIQKEWNFVVQAEGEEPLINDHVLSIMDNEHLHCLLPTRYDESNDVLENTVLRPRPVDTKDDMDSSAFMLLLLPQGPQVWDGPQTAVMKGIMNVPEPLLPMDVMNLQFKRKFDGRQSIRFGDSVSPAKKKRGGGKEQKTTTTTNDTLWKSLRSTSRSGLY